MEEALLPQIKDGSPKNLRKLDEFERGLVRVSRDYHGALKQAAVLGIKGMRIDVARLKAALKLMERRHPAARSVLVDWETLEEVDAEENIIPVFEMERENEDTWKTLWQNEQSIPVQLNISPIKVFVLQGDDQSEILVSAFHFVADGISLMELTHETLLAMEDLTIKWPAKDWIKSQYEITETVFPKYCLRGYGFCRAFTEVLCKTLCYRIDHIDPEEKPISEKEFSSGSLLSQGKLCQADLLHLRNISKNVYNVTLHPVLCVAAMRAVAENIDPDKPSYVTAGSIINLRPVYKHVCDQLEVEPSDMRHLSSAVTVRSYLGGEVIKDPEELWREVMKIQQQFKSKSTTSLLAYSLVAGIMFKNIPIDGYGDSLLVSNLGKSCLKPSYDTLGDINFLYPLLNYNILTHPYVCFTTFNGELNYSVIGTPRWLQQEKIDSICASIKRILKQMLERHREQLDDHHLDAEPSSDSNSKFQARSTAA
uniref:Condensation domain-containing protein n=1 Tax=Aplanochytrium stocchinoi TaxID=215587 RepID=A0A7S3LHV7_9STRA|eukprot:CAMPEP_0204873002 /NCGR_PEP_ID=MMETSP1348-20121228/39456_1 /ASSEMBLY_ACC=CAM_ASM_000700 /TAXON_ID=215587 /ORGANISM="Aplanochytrium stocchinoi, Strain GSBS06" /LENGTH=480 /DNA_ID=CAMNT_0052028109 /DNA_START=41 /DNA_END=1483 /DNA_ORIENTATION=+